MSLKCEICESDYEKDTVMISCEKCDLKVPIGCDGDGSKCYIKCEYCKKTVCNKHRFPILPYGSTDVEEICEECFMEIDSYDGKYVNVFDVRIYYDNIIKEQDILIDILSKENAKLQAMVDYQPDGKGFVEAKEHFEGLVEEN